ncbi:Ni/Fe hydrogenase subunit alpha [Neptuniibacter sp.]|uniref:Ni/Fe hydrogenase subunit alpha n=1 Tax=Neptuniibacter sp. TaxID=1962643 RepID=UPI002634053B|nr:Ni/Fe hydrogenase subunit alpha [Neptuniibacter sp.]MCP4598717.1 Ni/Fe hydrogenase subunit alpha [Neptuniibacter sp.]
MAERRVKIDVPSLARVEGEGALHLKIEQGKLQHLQFKIYEPPRFFEMFLEGRHYSEVPDIVARICGICPVAYQVSAVNALESLFQVKTTPWINQMRRLLYLGEWLQSHSLHVHLLALPDYFGYNTVLELAGEHPEEVRRGFALQDSGNRIMRLLGGRSVHPVGIKVGGFHKAPSHKDVAELLSFLEEMLPQAVQMTEWIASVPIPDQTQEFNSVALVDSNYSVEKGRLLSSSGLDINEVQYEDYFEETQCPHSTALWSNLRGKDYLVGPLARLNLNHQALPEFLQKLLVKLGNPFPSQNMFHSMLARGVEICFALHEAISILKQYELPERSYVDVDVKAGSGCGWSEAPRGLLWHRYKVSKEGLIEEAKIVPPTSQNQARIEQDLHWSLAQIGLDQPDEVLRLHSEKVIRNYDPCISCATHFLKLTTERSS